MEAIKSLLHSRVRNQISNIILFGSMISITAFGLILGMLAGVTALGHAPSLPPALKLFSILAFTIGGFSTGVFFSIAVSPMILRYAFFAKKVGRWNNVDVYRAADEDLPGKTANVFIAGFSFGIGPLKPAIFVAESATRILSRTAMEAVFAHEMSHLRCQHLLKRTLKGIGAFLVGSLLTSVTLLGLHWSGYTELGGFFSIIAGIVPAALTWLTIRSLAWDQELEADAYALTHFNILPESLLEALRVLQKAATGTRRVETHPLVAARIEILKNKYTDGTLSNAA